MIEWFFLLLLLGVCILFMLVPYFLSLPWGAGWNAMLMGSIATGIIIAFFILKFKGGSN